MKYTLYLRTAEGDHFLQKAAEEDDLHKSHATIQRWIGQMNLVVRNANQAMLVVAKDGYAFKEARYIAGGRRVWRQLTSVDQMRIQSPQPPAAPTIGAAVAQALIRPL